VLVVGAVVAAAGVLVLGARIASRSYADDSLWANALASLGGTMRPGDFGYVFLAAGNDVLAGRSPYMDPDAFEGPPQAPYAYPPLLALLVTPLSALPERALRGTFLPGVLFSLILIAAMVGALLLLDVRDWRCYPVALLAPFTLEAIEYGAVGPLLVLLVALLWRYRDRPLVAGAASGLAIVTKLFLWPLVVWLALTRRLRAAVVGVLVAAGLALASWIVIGFRGLAEYPRLLSRLVEVEAHNSYSAFALLRMVDVPEPAARALVVVSGLALLALAWRAARDPGSSPRERDRRSLGLALAAALVLTPILWIHYLVLLYVPIALWRPRLSAIWLVPLALTVLEYRDWYRGWPRGEAGPLLSTAFVTALVLVVTLRRRESEAEDRRTQPVAT
jgi:hypothetical protein